ncbi:MAG: tyrosine-type recombinase/integrase [Actinomycetota bacterium]|nr:tyrosine-type recombinase/integrase [Actinomycetota bacterium]
MYRVDGARRAVWYAKYRLPDGRQLKKRIGPAWAERGRPPEGFYTKRLAEEWLREVLHQAAHGELAVQRRTGVGFAQAAADWMRYIEVDRERKPSTVAGYRWILNAQLLPAFGGMAVEEMTTEVIERWLARLGGAASSRRKALVLLHGILKRARKAWGLAANAASDVEKPPLRRSGEIQVFSPEEVWALVRAAASREDAALYLTAAFTGLRMGELIALCWRDVDFPGSAIRVRASYSTGALTTPKSGKVRAVPMAPDVASALAALGRRADWVGEDDLVFPGETGSFLDGSALRRRYKRALVEAGLRPLRFHDLRHTFGTRMIAKADIRRVQEWMGHADIQTTMRYLHYSPRAQDAALVAEAFALDGPGASEDHAGRAAPASLSG